MFFTFMQSDWWNLKHHKGSQKNFKSGEMHFVSLTEKWRGYSSNLMQHFDCFWTVGWLQSDIKNFLHHLQIQCGYVKCSLTSQEHNAHWIRFVKLLQKNIKSIWDTIRNFWIFSLSGSKKHRIFSILSDFKGP